LQFTRRDGLRIDTGFSQGDAVATHYDPMIAKMIAHGPTRAAAQRKLAEALAKTQLSGFRTNLAFLSRLVQEPDFMTGNMDTGFIERNVDRLAKGGVPPIEVIAAALLHAGGHLSAPASSSPFDTLTNFRLWHGETQNFEFLVDGAPLKASLTDQGNMNFMATHAGESTSFILLNFDNDCVRLVFSSRTVSLVFFGGGDVLTIGFGGAIHEFAIAEFSAGHGSEEDSEGAVIAPMPGLVSMVNVKPGDRVTKGDIIAVTESMKMEFALRAPRAGKIAMVNVAAGEQVEEGAIIAAIEDADA
jgi:3-methylcrotonyl-CoA carboxylase alpha subunit